MRASAIRSSSSLVAQPWATDNFPSTPCSRITWFCATLRVSSSEPAGGPASVARVPDARCPSKACLSEESTQLQRIRRATRIVPAFEPPKPVPRFQERVRRVPKGYRGGSVHDADHPSWFQHPSNLLERREWSGQVLEDRARKCRVE